MSTAVATRLPVVAPSSSKLTAKKTTAGRAARRGAALGLGSLPPAAELQAQRRTERQAAAQRQREELRAAVVAFLEERRPSYFSEEQIAEAIGAELERAQNLGDLVLLASVRLDRVPGRPQTQVRLTPALVRGIVSVIYIGEGIGAFLRCAAVHEVERRLAVLDGEGAGHA